MERQTQQNHKVGPFVLDTRINPVNLGTLAGAALAAFWWIADLDKRVSSNTLALEQQVGAIESRLDRMEQREALQQAQAARQHEQVLTELRAIRSEMSTRRG